MEIRAILGSAVLGLSVCVIGAPANAQTEKPAPAGKPGPKASAAKPSPKPEPTPLSAYFGRFDNPHIGPYAYVLSGSLWLSPKIYVCWDNPSPQYQAEMDLVRQSVRDTWERYSGLAFVGWGTCAKVNRGIRITIADVGPYTNGLGRQLDTGQPGGMFLNFTFLNWSPECQDSAMRTTCIRSVAIHEFGHAIGFSHEQNRPDKPGECKQPPQGPDGDKMLTPYDKTSVMNYCFNIYNPDLKLSALDISAVRTLYGSEVDKTTTKP